MSSQKTTIKPFLNAVEGYGSTFSIEGNDSIIPFGPIYIKKTKLRKLTKLKFMFLNLLASI